MTRLEQYQQKSAALLDQREAILATADKDHNGELTEDQQAEYDKLKIAWQANERLVADQREIEAAERVAPAVQTARGNGEGGDVPVSVVATEQEQRAAQVYGMAVAEYREVDTQVRARVGLEREATADFPSLGEQLQAIARAETDPLQTDHRLLYQAEMRAAASGMGATVPSEGGFFLQETFSSKMIDRAYSTGQIMSRVTKTPLDPGSEKMTLQAIDETSRATGSRAGGVQMYWVDEATAATKSMPKFRKLELELKGLAGLWYITDRLLRNAAALGSRANRAFSDELIFTVENAFFRGTGSGQPQGITEAPCLVTVAKETGQDAVTIVYKNVNKMWSRMWAPSRANAVWLINQDCEPTLDDMAVPVGTGGVPVYLPAGGLSASPFATLKGRPVIPVEYCSTVGTVGDIMLVDYSQYEAIDGGPPEQASSMHVRFLQHEMTFRIIYYVDGMPSWHSKLTPFQGGSTKTLSPFVALATRA